MKRRQSTALAAIMTTVGLAAVWLLWLADDTGISVVEAQESPTVSSAVWLMGAVPADASLAGSVDLIQLVDSFAIDGGEALVGSDSALMLALNETLTGRFGIAAEISGIGFYAAYDDDKGALLLAGTTSGRPTLLEHGQYRGQPIYRAEFRREELYLVVLYQGLVVGSLDGVTGVLDVAFGDTRSLADVMGSSVSDLGADTTIVTIVNASAESALSDLFEDFESVEYGVLSVSATGLRVTVDTVDADAAANLVLMMSAMVDEGLSELMQALAAQAESAESLFEEFSVYFSLAGVGDVGAPAVASDGDRVSITWAVPPGLALAGSLSAVAIPAFLRYMRRSRITEAEMNLRRLFDSSVAYYDNDHVSPAGEIVPAQFPASIPLTPAEVPCGDSHLPTPDEWNQPTWQALNFGMYDPHHYSYQYDSVGVGAGASFVVAAFGDLDCDGVYSTFVRVGTVDSQGEVRGGAGIYQENELE